MKHKLGRKLLGLLFMLVIIGVVPGMSLTAYADSIYETYKTNGTLVKIEGVSNVNWYIIDYSDTTVTLFTKECIGGSKFDENGSSNTYENSTVYNYLAAQLEEGGKFASISSAVSEISLLTQDQANRLSTNQKKCTSVTYQGFWWLCSQGYTDKHACFVGCRTGSVQNGRSLDYINVGTELGVRPALKLNLSSVIFSSESNTFSLKPAGYNVTITKGGNMTKTAASGAESQTGVTGAITDVVYTANDGYYFPEDYSVAAVNGISVARDSYTQITVSGTPTADAAITLTAPTAKTTPDAPATASATGCTTSDNNDGKLTGVTTAMEYKKSDADSWTAGTGNDITGLVPGTYYVRVKATDTTNASGNQTLTIADYNTAAANTVSGTISALPDFSNVTTANKDAIEAARTAYNALTDDQKTYVSADTLKKLTDAEDKLVIIQVMSEVSAKTGSGMTYTGNPIQLINTPTTALPAGYTMYYAVTTENVAPTDDNLYTTSIPAKTDAGTYYVWYKVTGDDNHSNTTAANVPVTINKATVTAPTIASKVYTGQTQTADVAESTLYSVTTNDGGTNVTADGYDVVLTLKDAANYKWTDSTEAAKTLKFMITQATAPEVNAPTLNAVTYDPAKTLANLRSGEDAGKRHPARRLDVGG